jgi:hypothetical protein
MKKEKLTHQQLIIKTAFQCESNDREFVPAKYVKIMR